MKFSAQLNFFTRIDPLEIMLFTKHLHVMIAAGIPITESLSSLAKESKSGRFKKIIENVVLDIENGSNLSSALVKHKNVFDQFYISLISVGEESGTLEDSLKFLSEQLIKQYSLNQKIKTATLYPSVILVATAVMGSFISYFVLPKLTDFFISFDVALPPATRALISFAEFMKNYGLLTFVSIFIFILFFLFLIQIKSVRFIWDKLILKFPIFGEIIASDQLSRFSRNLSILIKSGVPATKSLEITADTLTNLKFKVDVLNIAKSLSEGKNIGSVLKKYREFPSLVAKMVAIGEKSGQLDNVLSFLGDFYEEEIDSVSKNLITILEPALLLIIGLVVGFIALAIITPIYELTGGIGR